MPKYDYGQQVWLKSKGDKVYIVGVTVIENETESASFNAPVGSIFYVIEFMDGSSMTVPEDQLEPYVPEQKEMGTRFTWGDEVKIKKIGSDGNETDVYAAVVGVTPIKTEQQSKHFKVPLGSTLYLVEYGDGSDELILEDNLEMYIPAQKDEGGETNGHQHS